MREPEVTKRIAERLKADGAMDIKVRYGQEKGADIECELPHTGRILFIEAKGERPGRWEGPKRRVAVGEALFQILSVYDVDVVCVIALPFTEGYQTLVKKILPGLRRLRLHILFVSSEDIWHLPPQANGFFPTRPESLIEVLDQ